MELWTPAHTRTLIPALIVMFLLSALLRLALGKKDLSVRMIPFQILACIIVLLEVGKQVISLLRGYDLYHLPFHFCSLYIFMLPMMAFYKGKHRQAVQSITAAITASLFLLMLIYPNLIYSAGNIENYFHDYMDFHTVTFHNVVMLSFLLILTLDLHAPRRKGELKYSMWFIAGFCTVSASMAHLLKTNYANYYSCNIPLLETVRLNVENAIGAVPAKLLYILIVSSLNFLFVALSYGVYLLSKKLLRKKESVAT